MVAIENVSREFSRILRGFIVLSCTPPPSDEAPASLVSMGSIVYSIHSRTSASAGVPIFADQAQSSEVQEVQKIYAQISRPRASHKSGPSKQDQSLVYLPTSLEAATDKFMAKDSLARKVLGDTLVDHFGGTRLHEVKLFNQTVTNWEMERYMELI